MSQKEGDKQHERRDVDVLEHNRIAWNDQQHQNESPWAQPVSSAVIERARGGEWEVVLTPTLPVPRNWFGNIKGKQVLCLASGGGQQAPVLAAAGAEVTSYDRSEAQLQKDELVAIREDLEIETICGDMADLSCFPRDAFDLVFHPVSNVFARDVSAVWRECARVTKSGGRLLSGFMNPDFFLFDHDAIEAGGELVVRFSLPFADVEDLPEEALKARIARGEALEFSHSLDVQIGAQIAAGYVIAGFYEDRWDNEATPLNAYMPTSMATLGIKQEI